MHIRFFLFQFAFVAITVFFSCSDHYLVKYTLEILFGMVWTTLVHLALDELGGENNLVNAVAMVTINLCTLLYIGETICIIATEILFLPSTLKLIRGRKGMKRGKEYRIPGNISNKEELDSFFGNEDIDEDDHSDTGEDIDEDDHRDTGGDIDDVITYSKVELSDMCDTLSHFIQNSKTYRDLDVIKCELELFYFLFDEQLKKINVT